MDPMRQAGTPPQGMYSPPVGDVSHAHDVQPPADMATDVNQARNAVQSALASAPFDAATAGPVDALNAAPVTPEPIHIESTVTPAPAVPPAPSHGSDTPMLVLPTDNGSSVTATEPVAVQTPMQPAPPPVPPPLNMPPIQ
jgi:hypothetical protein